MAELPRIKVCGMTRGTDVRAALAAGADGLGFVCHRPSPRNLAAEEARRLIAPVGDGATSVLVVVDATPEEGRALLQATGAGALQLCGDQRPADWSGFPWPLLRRVAVEDGAAQEMDAWSGLALGFVLDHPSGPGGSGHSVDLERAAALAARGPCLLAGGLGPTDVAQRVAAVRPLGVDASSRLEARPGEKDPDVVRAFVQAARSALERAHGITGVGCQEDEPS